MSVKSKHGAGGEYTPDWKPRVCIDIGSILFNSIVLKLPITYACTPHLTYSLKTRLKLHPHHHHPDLLPHPLVLLAMALLVLLGAQSIDERNAARKPKPKHSRHRNLCSITQSHLLPICRHGLNGSVSTTIMISGSVQSPNSRILFVALVF